MATQITDNALVPNVNAGSVAKPTPSKLTYSKQVADQQVALNKLGAGLKVDGLLGPLTKAAISKYGSASSTPTGLNSIATPPTQTTSTSAPVSSTIQKPVSPTSTATTPAPVVNTGGLTQAQIQRLGLSPEDVEKIANPAGIDPLDFQAVIQKVKDRLNYSNDLMKQRALIVKHLFDSPLSKQEMEQLPEDVRNVVNQGQDASQLQLRILNDQIAGRSESLANSIQDLTSGYQTAIEAAETKRAEAEDNILKYLQLYGAEAVPFLKTKYPEASEVIEELAGMKTIEEREKTLEEGTDSASLLAYAQQYAADGKIPTGMPKGTFGTVAELAKELPKQKGQIIDINTGVAPTGDTTLANSLASLSSVIDLAEQLKKLDEERMEGVVPGVLGKVLGSTAQTKYLDLRSQIVDLLSRARSGAALTPSEEKRYGDMLPGRFSEPFFLGPDSSVRIDNFINNITSDLNNKAKAKGWAIYEVSTVNTPMGEKKVGEVVEAPNGLSGRVNADGTITSNETSFNSEGSGSFNAKKIASAIKEVESGGNYKAVGDNGTSKGAYQFQPNTWKGWAKQYLGDPNAPMTPENQDMVAEAKIQDLIDEGYGPKEIALIWNGGEPKEKKGYNSKLKVHYDSGAYAKKVLAKLG